MSTDTRRALPLWETELLVIALERCRRERRRHRLHHRLGEGRVGVDGLNDAGSDTFVGGYNRRFADKLLNRQPALFSDLRYSLP